MNSRILLYFIPAIMMLTGCSGALDDIKPRHAIPQEDVTESDMSKILNGVYSSMEYYTYQLWFNDDIQGENFATSTGVTPMLDPCNMSPENVNSNVNILSYWRNSFSTLYQVNYLLGMYENSSDKDNVTLREIGGACYYFRAFIYYRLAVHYGNVPVVKECTDDIIAISPEKDVWAFIESDLSKAHECTTGTSTKWYVSADAINALAARVMLFQGKKEEAAGYALEVLKNTAYSLSKNSMEYSSIYLPNSSSNEIIFGYVNNTRTSSYCNFAGVVNDVDGNWDYSPAKDCFDNLYSDVTSGAVRCGDIRKVAVFSSRSGENNRVIRFSNGQQQLAVNEDYLHTPVVVSRIAEMYLVAAEGLGKENGAVWLHKFLSSRYLLALSENDIKNLSDIEYQDLSLDERRREFYAEGMRWQDVKRTGRYDLLNTLDGRTYLMYYPIPQAEIDIAGTAAYPQNPGY